MMKNDPQARDFMRRDVITVNEKCMVLDLAKLFAEHQITGCPVVNDDGDLVGVVSQTDIVQHLQELARMFDGEFYGTSENEHGAARRGPLRVGDFMSRKVVDSPEDTRASELSRRMLLGRIHRIIITRGKKVCGIVTTMDILKVL